MLMLTRNHRGLNVLALLMIFSWLPEVRFPSSILLPSSNNHLVQTKQRSLEELDYVFAVPTRTHMKYQVSEVAPYWVKTTLLRRKGLPEPQLYKFDNVAPATNLVEGEKATKETTSVEV